MLRQDFNLNQINSTTGAQVAGQQLQLIIPANVYECSSYFEVIYGGITGDQSANTLFYRPEFAFGFGQATIQWDGLQRGIYQFLPQCQLSYFRKFMKNEDNSLVFPQIVTATANTTYVYQSNSNQKYRICEKGQNATGIVTARYPIKQFLAGLFSPQQTHFKVDNQLVVTLQISQITGVIGSFTTTTHVPNDPVSCTNINIRFLAKVSPNQNVELPAEIRQVQQYQYSAPFVQPATGSATFAAFTMSNTPIQNIPQDQLCDYIMMDLISQGNQTVTGGAALANQTWAFLAPNLLSVDLVPPITSATINKNGFSMIQSSDLAGDMSQDFKAQLALSLGETSDYNCFGGVYQYLYSNYSIQHNLTVQFAPITNGTNANGTITLQQGAGPINLYMAYSLILPQSMRTQ